MSHIPEPKRKPEKITLAAGGLDARYFVGQHVRVLHRRPPWWRLLRRWRYRRQRDEPLWVSGGHGTTLRVWRERPSPLPRRLP